MMVAGERTVAVVGDWGELGMWIIKLLLKEGYTVRSSFPFSAGDLAEMKSQSGINYKLEQREVDLLDYRSLVKQFQGCCGVFYVPAPKYTLNGSPDYPTEEIENEVRSVLNVVEACASLECVNRLIITSCMSSMLWNEDSLSEAFDGIPLDDNSWSNLEFCKKEKLWCGVLKTLVEKAAWALARDRDLDLVTINPATVIGSSHTLEINNASIFAAPSSLKIMKNYSSTLGQSGLHSYVHIDALATAHLMAFEANHAFGRYACFQEILSNEHVDEIAKYIYPNRMISHRLELFKPCPSSNEKLIELGVQFDPSENTAQPLPQVQVCHDMSLDLPIQISMKLPSLKVKI